MYIRDWFKPLFPLFLIWSISPLPPPAPAEPALLAKFRLWRITTILLLNNTSDSLITIIRISTGDSGGQSSFSYYKHENL
jgi:hypothetical protein